MAQTDAAQGGFDLIAIDVAVWMLRICTTHVAPVAVEPENTSFCHQSPWHEIHRMFILCMACQMPQLQPSSQPVIPWQPVPRIRCTDRKDRRSAHGEDSLGPRKTRKGHELGRGARKSAFHDNGYKEPRYSRLSSYVHSAIFSAGFSRPRILTNFFRYALSFSSVCAWTMTLVGPKSFVTSSSLKHFSAIR